MATTTVKTAMRIPADVITEIEKMMAQDGFGAGDRTKYIVSILRKAIAARQVPSE